MGWDVYPGEVGKGAQAGVPGERGEVGVCDSRLAEVAQSSPSRCKKSIVNEEVAVSGCQ